MILAACRCKLYSLVSMFLFSLFLFFLQWAKTS